MNKTNPQNPVAKKRLTLSSATIRSLDASELTRVVGGSVDTISRTLPNNPCHPF